MDRFIVVICTAIWIMMIYLKSSMDRFIARSRMYTSSYLKSSMDRFIGGLQTFFKPVGSAFKIQYG